ncbi:MAG: OmpA family protein [Vicingaceae bacterium]
MLKLIWCTLFSFLTLSSLQAQERELKKGIKHYEFQEYDQAINWFKKSLEKDKTSYTAVKLLANSYRKIRQFEKAELYYLLTVNSDSTVAEDHLYYGQVLKANGKLSAAKQQFLTFSEMAESSFLGNIMIQSIDEIKSWAESPKEFNSLPESKLNSAKSEFAPWFFQNWIYITSDRAENFYSSESSAWTGDPFLSIYQADTSILNNPENDDFREVNGLLTTKYHDGPLSINKQEDRIVISRISNEMRGNDFINRMKLYEGQYEKGKWKGFEPLPFNSDEYSVGHAAFADSGKTLYFASDMPGGFGGMDLYQTTRIEGDWSEPKNLGAAINTPLNEVFPYVKENVLYFSSDGYVGYGGLDIFYSKKLESGWQAPENIKAPINSNRDDFSIYFVTDTTGYYASNREGGMGKDDIYSFVKTPPQKRVEVHTILELQGLPVEGVKVSLVDQNDSIVQVSYTDSEGRLTFVDLPYQKDYLIQLESGDGSAFQEGRFFLTDKKGNKLKLLQNIKEGLYTFNALPTEEVQLTVFENADPGGTLGNFVFVGKVYKKLPGEETEPLMVYLLNDEGEIVDSVLTDEFGEFRFKRLNPDEQYLVQLKEDEPEMNLALVSEKGRIYQLAKRQANGKFELNQQIDASKNSAYASNLGYTSVIVRLEHEGTPMAFTKVQIFNSKGELIATVISNENGEFQYNELQFDDVYFMTLPEVSDEVKFKALAYVLDPEGDPLYLINQLRDGRFRFNSLPFDEYTRVQEEKLSFVPNIVKVAGQIYKKLPGDYNQGVTVYILDEEGDIIDSTFTDQRGRFNFEKLRSDETYSFKVKGGAEGFNLAMLDKNNVIIDKATLNENGNFAYKKLTYQVAQFDELELLEADLAEDEYSHEVFGQVYQKLPGDFGDSLKVYIYDEEGNFLGTAFTDKEGKFNFNKLKKDQNYLFKIEHEEEHFQLLTFDENDEVLDKVIKNRFGQFKYQKLDMQHHEILLEEASDHQVIYYDKKRIDLTKYTVHYRFDKSNLEKSEMQKLDELIKVLKGKDLKVEIISHTDTRGTAEYNRSLSQERTKVVLNYLIENGFQSSQFEANYYGELRPIIDCEKYKCDNDDHRLNRRTEFKFLDF